MLISSQGQTAAEWKSQNLTLVSMLSSTLRSSGGCLYEKVAKGCSDFLP